jgi:uronate dehydrogenase
VTIGIEHPEIRFEIVYGASANTRTWYDNSNAARLGYRPADNSEAFAADVLAREKPGHPRGELYQGGLFVHSGQIAPSWKRQEGDETKRGGLAAPCFI